MQADEALPEKYRDHALVSNWVGHRDCHIKPDLEPYRVCRRPTFLRECSNDKTKIYP
ncbi:type II toxin-antitoxin system mRNA interferase toxin, RelE/StbE family [Acinetobacter sp. YT-02]|uniref:type II toxin-antitoxin system mRNA interferase toxin, RelE/StbE family n=1 Tax=Acinetobacter TaxID=469 RepID=UPI001F5B7BC3|nr:type II toxin-antitoxin system mRNA interferase toxin, RelE/StbE family [Acinetobacter sp. YT-02]